MDDAMRGPDAVQAKLLLMALVLTAVAGCSTAAGRPLGAQARNPLLTSAKRTGQGGGDVLPLPRELDKRVLPPYVVEPGDVLLVLVADLDSPVRLPGDQPVFPDGTINLGRYGRVEIAGKTVDEIEPLVRAAVQAQPEGKGVGVISVRIMTRASKVYYVLGEVNAPGAFPLAGRETVLDGIMAAGGLTDRASHAHIILSRPSPPETCRTVLPICYREIVQLGDTTTNYQLAPGDRVFVSSKTACEELFHRRRDKSSCNGRQVPCALPGEKVPCAEISKTTGSQFLESTARLP